MDRLTTPDEPIEGGMRRARVDVKTVKEQAMTLYWRLKKYEDTGLTPERLVEIDRLYTEMCREVGRYRNKTKHCLNCMCNNCLYDPEACNGCDDCDGVIQDCKNYNPID